MDIEIKYLFHFHAYFHVLDTFHRSCLNAFKSWIEATYLFTKYFVLTFFVQHSFHCQYINLIKRQLFLWKVIIIKILFTQEYTSIRKEGEIKYTKIVIFKLISNVISRMEILTLWLLNFVNIAKFVRWLHEQVVKCWFDWSDILMHPLLTHCSLKEQSKDEICFKHMLGCEYSYSLCTYRIG